MVSSLTVNGKGSILITIPRAAVGVDLQVPVHQNKNLRIMKRYNNIKNKLYSACKTPFTRRYFYKGGKEVKNTKLVFLLTALQNPHYSLAKFVQFWTLIWLNI